MERYVEILRDLVGSGIRFLVIGVTGINFYAKRKQLLFNTGDCDLFLPLDPENLLACWQALKSQGLELTSHGEPLETPLDRWLAQRVVERRAAVTARGADELQFDLTLTMKGFTFEELWPTRRSFELEGVTVPVAPLAEIIESKKGAGRDKDFLFFVTHDEILEQLLEEDESS